MTGHTCYLKPSIVALDSKNAQINQIEHLLYHKSHIRGERYQNTQKSVTVPALSESDCF